MDNPFKAYVVVLFVAGVLALNYPLLSLYDHVRLPLGIPLLYFYLFLAWLVIVVLITLIMERISRRQSQQSPRR